MAMTQLALVFIGALAAVATMGMFVRFDDVWTKVIVIWLAAVLWGIFGLSAFDVIVVESYAAVLSKPIMPLVWIGFGLAFMIAMFGLWFFVRAMSGEVGAERSEGMIDE